MKAPGALPVGTPEEDSTPARCSPQHHLDSSSPGLPRYIPRHPLLWPWELFEVPGMAERLKSTQLGCHFTPPREVPHPQSEGCKLYPSEGHRPPGRSQPVQMKVSGCCHKVPGSLSHLGAESVKSCFVIKRTPIKSIT